MLHFISSHLKLFFFSLPKVYQFIVLGKKKNFSEWFLVTTYGTVMIWIICNNDFKSCQEENRFGIQWLNDKLGSELWSMNIIDKPGSGPRQPEGTFPHNEPKISQYYFTSHSSSKSTRFVEHESKYNNLFSK